VMAVVVTLPWTKASLCLAFSVCSGNDSSASARSWEHGTRPWACEHVRW
jgi:hypothetical protein